MTKYSTFTRAEYRDAKAFLADAVELFRAISDTAISTRWQKPDGSIWLEYESRLEPPEWDYRLAPSREVAE